MVLLCRAAPHPGHTPREFVGRSRDERLAKAQSTCGLQTRDSAPLSAAEWGREATLRNVLDAVVVPKQSCLGPRRQVQKRAAWAGYLLAGYHLESTELGFERCKPERRVGRTLGFAPPRFAVQIVCSVNRSSSIGRISAAARRRA